MFSVALSVNPALSGTPWPLASTLPCGVRTFLPGKPGRPPDPLANNDSTPERTGKKRYPALRDYADSTDGLLEQFIELAPVYFGSRIPGLFQKPNVFQIPAAACGTL